MTPGDMPPSVIWRPVGGGRRAHAFSPGDLLYAYCGVGPGDPTGAAPAAHCRTCEGRLRRIAAQDAELDRLLG